MNNVTISSLVHRVQIFFFIVIGLILYLTPANVNAQEKPPKPITVKVRNYQPLAFGTFIQGGNYGTVLITPQGARSATGSIFLMSSTFSPALFDIESIPGTLITVHNGVNATLTGGTGTLELQIGDSNPPSPFITTGEHTTVTIGGTLIVQSLSANPAGPYSGTFEVTFIQQ